MIRDIEVQLPGGETKRFGDIAPGAALIVNVASKCGYTPQYAGLEELHKEFGPQGLTVIGVPCNQFMMQEPGTDEQISEFCQLNYGVTFQLLSKTKVNGRGTDPLFKELRKGRDPEGKAGLVHWNFEKFVVDRGPVDSADGGEPRIVRFRSATEPNDPALRAAIEAALAA